MDENFEKQLAEYLHSKFCASNHTDACGWFYEKDNWTRWAHDRYLKKTKEVIAKIQELAADK